MYGILPTADGWIAMIGVPPALRAAFYNTIGRPDLLDDPRFSAMLLDPDDRKALFVILAEVFRTRTSDDWLTRLKAAGQRVAPVRSYAEATADPQVIENGYILEIADETTGTSHVIGSPIRMSDTPAKPGLRAPELGEHTEEILLEHGYSWEEIAQLREQGAV